MPGSRSISAGVSGFLPVPLLHAFSGAGGRWDEALVAAVAGGLLLGLAALTFCGTKGRAKGTARKSTRKGRTR